MVWLRKNSLLKFYRNKKSYWLSSICRFGNCTMICFQSLQIFKAGLNFSKVAVEAPCFQLSTQSYFRNTNWHQICRINIWRTSCLLLVYKIKGIGHLNMCVYMYVYEYVWSYKHVLGIGLGLNSTFTTCSGFVQPVLKIKYDFNET